MVLGQLEIYREKMKLNLPKAVVLDDAEIESLKVVVCVDTRMHTFLKPIDRCYSTQLILRVKRSIIQTVAVRTGPRIV